MQQKTRRKVKTPVHIKKFLEQQTQYNILRYNARSRIMRRPEQVWKRLTLPVIRGGSRKHYRMNDYVFQVDEDEDMIIAFSKNKTLPCFKITFSPEEKNISIDISYYPDCSYNKDLAQSSGTIIMFRLIFYFILNYKDIHLYKYISLTDISAIPISHRNKDIYVNLANMYFLCTGCTWYSSIIPLFLKNHKDHTTFMDDRNRIIGPTALSWRKFLDNLPKPIRDEFQDKITIGSNFDVNIPGSARIILNKLKELRKNTIMYTLYEKELLRAFDVTSLTGKEWCIPLKDGKIVVPNYQSFQMVCKNKNGWVLPEWGILYADEGLYDSLRKVIQSSTIYEDEIRFEKVNIE